MIFVQDYDDVLKALGREYFVFNIQYVPDLKAWAEGKGVELSEPYQPMKLIPEGDKLTMVIQSEIREEMLNDIINGLSVRLLLKDTTSNPAQLLNSVKKRLAYCFLKECAKAFAFPGTEGDEFLEDDWVLKEMNNYGFFNE